MIKRFDRLDVATSDLTDASGIYERNFGFAVRREGGDEATIAIGDAQLRLRSGASVADLIATAGEGLAAVWLEADNVELVAKALRQIGAAFQPIHHEGGRRILEVDPRSANMTPLFVFDRKG